ncbi:MAG TPA: type VI secretion system tube protein Hcp [Thermohalobaculum sp.]|nr:type VI secretion system tube protein Hcp [Thermohalobaculum sp.]
MQIIGYLKLPDINGEADQEDHADEIEFFKLEWVDLTQRATQSIGRGLSRGSVRSGPIRICKWVDAASPYLMDSIFRAISIDEGKISLVKRSGDKNLDYMVITMKEAMISNYNMATHPDEDFVYEEVEFDFNNVIITYTEQAGDHTAGSEHEVEYDFRAAS